MRHSILFTALLSTAIVSHTVGAQDNEANPEAPVRGTIIKMYDSDALKAWATCAWDKLPVTSKNLLAYQKRQAVEPRNDDIPFASGKEALHLRINALCGNDLPPRHRNAIGTVQSAKERIFRSLVPETLGTKDKKVKAYICAHKMDGRYVMTETDLKKPKPKNRISGVSVECFRIESDGTLSDA